MKYYPTGKQAQAIDKYTQEKLGINGIALMESAASKLADAIHSAIFLDEKAKAPLDKSEATILSVVESGNNGGDAVAAAWMLKEKGYDTYIYEINGISRKTDSYKIEIEKAKERGVKFVDLKSHLEEVADYDVIIDGIFGVGLTRDVTGVQRDVVEAINKAKEQAQKGDKENVPFVVGVDIPSGISADTGHVLGAAVKCDMTVTFEFVKYGMLLNEGRQYSGNIKCEHIGLYVPESVSEMARVLGEEQVFMIDDKEPNTNKNYADNIYVCHEYDPEEINSLIPERKADSNKGTYGKVLIIAGSKEIYGAVYMAAEAAYRVGAGLVKVVTDIRNRDVLCDKLPEAMMLTYDTDKIGGGFEKDFINSIKWADVILAGPGLGTGKVSQKLMRILSDSLSSGQKLILDADALNIISMDNPSKWFKAFTKKAGIGNVIITPHMMEMLRIVRAGYDKKTYDFMIENLGLKSEIDFLKDYRKSQVYNLSYNNGIITVLKDARTVVAYTFDDKTKETSGYLREASLYVNTTGNSGMSKGGSGDVLAGMIAGLLTQNKSGEVSTSDTVIAAVSLHGRAGDIARDKVGERSMIARDIIEAIPECF